MEIDLWNLLLCLEHALDNLCDLSHHGYQEGMVTLIHQAFEILGFLFELLLDVVLHFVGDKSTGDLISYLADQCKVIRSKVLLCLLVCYFKDTDCMAAKFDWHQEHVTDHLVKSLVHIDILTKFISDFFFHGSSEVA